ncbi:membrane protein [Nitrosospira multiformis]|jgi:membrane protein|uniref:Membrane protein n=1 Tax=Nitrosospira multiformis TaxID=1231 RepID=A0A2T5IGU2_9PROT|nr:YihY/virulence factor BrkB family protein [Nitrosospira multiformis]PTQ83050.1 membrane protein [Nitrosospira multiformis]
MNIKEVWALVKASFSSWLDDYAPSMGAALAYYTMFSIAPLLLIVISTAGLVFGEEAVRGEIFGQLRDLMGDQGAAAVEGLLASVSKPEEGAAGAVVGTVLLLIGATTVFGELQNAFDRIWRVPGKDKNGGIGELIRTRLLSFGIILGIGFLMMVSLVFNAAVSALGKWWGGFFSELEILVTTLNFIFSFVFTTAVFAMLYKFMPQVKIQWKDVWLGAGVTALLFTIGKFLIGLYIGKSAISSGFGAAGSLVVVLVWVYYSAQIFLLGAEFTWVYSHARGSRKNQEIPPRTISAGPVEMTRGEAAEGFTAKNHQERAFR